MGFRRAGGNSSWSETTETGRCRYPFRCPMNLEPVEPEELGQLYWQGTHQLSAVAAPECLAHQLRAFYSGFCSCVLWSCAFGEGKHTDVSGVAVQAGKHWKKR